MLNLDIRQMDRKLQQPIQSLILHDYCEEWNDYIVTGKLDLFDQPMMCMVYNTVLQVMNTKTACGF